ncbi:MAG: glycosyltransferase family 39 protein [Candidatus Levybacteria bacterium]|nr:glycosyltransferase family 39 protein [Candidatus Levybacteria bacterium]
MKKRIIAILIGIFIVGILLRFYRLGDVPFGLHRDEAFLGYNAYSILETGKDMSGNFLPLHLKSFLFSPALYSYFSAPFIKIFDLNAFSVRFASALFGSLTILITYFLTRELIRISKLRISANVLALLSSLLLAVSPWHINLSRTATENAIVVFFIALGVLIYFLYLNINKWYLLILSFFCFFTTIFLYQAPRAFLPFFIPLLMLLFFNKNKKDFILKLLLFFAIIILPLFLIFNSRDLSLRIRTVSIFATSGTQLMIDEQIRTDGVFQTPVLLTRTFHNKFTMYTQQFLENYFSHFSYSFLFSDKSFPDRYRVPLAGILYFLELPLIIVGIFRLTWENKKLLIFLFGWILIVPLGSALTFDDIPNIQRTLIIFPALSIVEVFGLLQIIDFFRKNYWLKILGTGLTLIFIYNIFFYIHQYYMHVSRYRPWYRQDGYKELVIKVNALLGENKKAVVTDRESAPTIFFLFYSKYSPSKFQKETKNTKMKDFDRISFGQFEFSQRECPLGEDKDGKIKKENGIIFVNSGLCKEIIGVKETQIKRQDGSVAFRIY